MRPAADLVLAALVEDMEKRLAFMPPGGERAAVAGMKITFGILHREADDAAASRLAEIEELGGLLQQAAAACPSALADALLAAAEKAGAARADIRISALERVLDALRGALIELQAWLETSPHPEAGALQARCWDFLVRANRRRAVRAKPW